MASFLKKLVKKATPSPKKLIPQFVAKSEVLTKLGAGSLAVRAVKQNSSIAKAPDWSDTTAMRQNLRALHEEQTTPFSKTSSKIYERNQLPPGPEKDRLTAEINASTLKRGHLGIAVAGVAVGGAAGAALGAGNKVVSAADTAAVLRANPPANEAPFRAVDTWPDPNAYPDVLQQMYRTYPAGSPYAQRRTVPAAGASGEGLLTKAVRGMWNLLVPAAKRAS